MVTFLNLGAPSSKSWLPGIWNCFLNFLCITSE